MKRQYAACRQVQPLNWKNGSHQGEWSGHDVETFIMLLCNTGFRISDAVTFDMNRLSGTDCIVRAIKNNQPVFTVLPDELVSRLQSLAKRNGTQRPFMMPGGSTRVATVTDLWRRKLNRVWALCGRWEQSPHPHRFRHTFVRILLQNEVSPADVAILIGDTEEMVLKHYARWVPERQARLTSILREKLFPSVKRPKLLAMPKRAGQK